MGGAARRGRDRRLIARGRLFEALVRDNLVTGCTAAFRSDYKDLVIPVPAACAHNSWSALWSRPSPTSRASTRRCSPIASTPPISTASALPWRKKRQRQRTAATQIHRRQASPGGGPAGPLRAAYSRLEQNRHRYPVGQTQLQLLGGAIRHAERRIPILGETSSARRLSTASWELATLRYVRYRRGSGDGARMSRTNIEIRYDIKAWFSTWLRTAEIHSLRHTAIRRHVPGWSLHSAATASV